MILIILLLAFPGLAHEGADQGVELYFEALFPYLLPYLILTQWLLRLTTSMKRPISKSKLYIQTYLIGALGGFPTGAATISFLKNNKQLNAYEASKLLAICHAPSPLFIIGFVSNDLLGQYFYGWKILIVIHLVNLIPLILFIKKQSNASTTIAHSHLPSKKGISPFSESMRDSAPVLLLVGITVVFFTTIHKIISTLLLSILPNLSKQAQLLFTTSLEMTNGLVTATSLFENSPILPLLLSAILAIQSLSIHLQIIVLARTADISIKSYVLYRLLSFIAIPALYWLLFY